MSAKKVSKSVQEDVARRYTKMEAKEHILEIPDTYVGGVEEDDATLWVYDTQLNKMVFKSIKYVPGLYKIFDEIIVNARDHSVNDPTCKNIKVSIDRDEGRISCTNDGENGIPIVFHNEHNMYVPELIFGNLLTSGNYKKKGKIVGGKNGYGAKLANIFSTEFIIEVVDATRKLKYWQKFTHNMDYKTEPEITPLDGKSRSSVTISFVPDLTRFGITELSNDMMSLFTKRVYDIAACAHRPINVHFNGRKLDITTFDQYIAMFYEGDPPSEPIYEVVNDRWKVGIVFDSSSGFRHISFVNGIYTFQGGSHVNHVVEQVVNNVMAVVSKKTKGVKIKNVQIRDNLTFFIDAVIEDPSFSSQTKELLQSKTSSFGSKCQLSDDFMKRLEKTGLIDEVMSFAEFKAMADLKKTDGKKKSTLKNVEKLDDAKLAGSRSSHLTRLILTEGDSAKAFAIAGRDVIGNDRYGVFPLRGKLLNVREATASQLMNNEEIKNIKQIMGLKHGKHYKSISQLRYGGIIILTDADHDGTHIKGLIMNFIHFFWPSLMIWHDGFIQCMVTPIVRAWKTSDTKKKNLINFYNLNEFHVWNKEHTRGWEFKYYKGLGTFSDAEAKQYFKEFDDKLVKYIWEWKKIQPVLEDVEANEDPQEETDTEDSHTEDEEQHPELTDRSNKCHQALMLGFNKHQANKRKEWLGRYDPNNTIDITARKITYEDFIHKDLVHFSKYDVQRSVPSICDGFKPSQRKILFTCFERKLLTKEIKVSQLSGYVSAETCYHHGETSLMGAIINMAQNYVGSNNVHLITPNGQFGTRRMGGKDAASPRYIFTQLNELSPLIFRKEDTCVFKRVDEDGDLAEYEYFAPIIPTVLINGTEGIGTAYSTKIPPFNPKDIINNVRNVIIGKPYREMFPWFRRFTGKIIKTTNKKGMVTYKSLGKFEQLNPNELMITELPVGVWTQTYFKNIIMPMVIEDPKKPKNGEILVEAHNCSGNNSVKIHLVFAGSNLKTLVKDDEIEKHFKLSSNINITNMHMFDRYGRIQKYDTIEDIVRAFCEFRLEVYQQRKDFYLQVLQNKLEILTWKVKFLTEVLAGKIIVFKINQPRKKMEIITELVDHGYPKLSRNVNATEEQKTYDYITDINLFALTEEELKKLKDERFDRLQEFEKYADTPETTIWLNELDELEKAYNKWLLDGPDGNDDEDTKKKPIRRRKPRGE